MVNGAALDFTILYVCQVNQCRSAMAELLLRDRLSAAQGTRTWQVSSAGVAARPGVGLHPLARRLLQRQAIDVDGFASRQLTTDLILSADLVLTAERSQRAAVVRLAPDAAGRTFTMRQFARLADPDPAAPLDGPSLLRSALHHRGLRAAATPSDDDISDPVGGPLRGFRRCLESVEHTLSAFGYPAVSAGGWPRRKLIAR